MHVCTMPGTQTVNPLLELAQQRGDLRSNEVLPGTWRTVDISVWDADASTIPTGKLLLRHNWRALLYWPRRRFYGNYL